MVGVGCALLPDIIEHGLRITHHFGQGELVHMLEHAFSALLVPDHLKVTILPVVEIGEHDVVTHRTDASGHIVQFLALARGVHVEQHHRMGTWLLWMGDEGVHQAISRLDINVVFDHQSLPERQPNWLAAQFTVACTAKPDFVSIRPRNASLASRWTALHP
jgi:hypothetical protein